MSAAATDAAATDVAVTDVAVTDVRGAGQRLLPARAGSGDDSGVVADRSSRRPDRLDNRTARSSRGCSTASYRSHRRSSRVNIGTAHWACHGSSRHPGRSCSHRLRSHPAAPASLQPPTCGSSWGFPVSTKCQCRHISLNTSLIDTLKWSMCQRVGPWRSGAAMRRVGGRSINLGA